VAVGGLVFLVGLVEVGGWSLSGRLVPVKTRGGRGMLHWGEDVPVKTPGGKWTFLGGGR